MCNMSRWKRLLGISLALGMLLAAGCHAPQAGTSDPSSPESVTETTVTEEAPPETAEEELVRLKKTLQNFVREQDKVYRKDYHFLGGDFDDLLRDEAYDSMQLLGKSNGWAICLWQEGLTYDSHWWLFMGKYAAYLDRSYIPYRSGIYVIKGEEVIELDTACAKDMIDPEEVYLMLPEDMQWGLKEDYLEEHPFENC